MNQTEISTLLAIIAQVDNRALSPADVITWHGLLGDLRFDECDEAVKAHRRESTDWVMPAHVRKRVLAKRQDSAMRALPSSPHTLMPMPDWFHERVAEHKERTRMENAARKERGERAYYGETVKEPSDGRPGW